MVSLAGHFQASRANSNDGKARVYSLSELLNFPDPEWLIDGLIPKEAVSGLCGESGIGKSMLALDWALCVATGLPWHGKPIPKGYVLYIAAEGWTGLRMRAEAWLAHHKIHPLSIAANFGLVREPVIYETEAYDALVNRLETEIERDPALVILDTLARVIDGEENNNVAMAQFLKGADEWVRRYRSTVLVIHHKNATGVRERGHTSFRAALGSLFFIEKTPDESVLKLTNEKQRDAKEANDILLRKVDIPGTKSILLIPEDVTEATEVIASTPVPHEMSGKDMLTLLGSHPDGLTYGEWLIASQLTKTAFNRRRKKLELEGQIARLDSGRWHILPSSHVMAVDAPEGLQEVHVKLSNRFQQ